MMELSYVELYDLTPRSFNNKLVGYYNKIEQSSQNSWEQTRMIVHATFLPHSKKKVKPEEVMPFPWDKKRKKKKAKKVLRPNPEELKKILERYERK